MPNVTSKLSQTKYIDVIQLTTKGSIKCSAFNCLYCHFLIDHNGDRIENHDA